jgi:organic hydroperoxide reductase OsmC/OhrA
MADHTFEIALTYPATAGQLTPPDAHFSRNNVLRATGKHEVAASSPAAFGGDSDRYNPEELMLMSLSQCHMLTYLAVAAKKRITIVGYEDRATGELGISGSGPHGVAGKMSMQKVVLHPRVTVVKGTDLADANAIHAKAHANCFMANSVNFPVTVEPTIVEADV